jgi:hypothetical protein
LLSLIYFCLCAADTHYFASCSILFLFVYMYLSMLSYVGFGCILLVCLFSDCADWSVIYVFSYITERCGFFFFFFALKRDGKGLSYQLS